MYERYHITTAPAKVPSIRIGKLTITRSDKCLNCGRCKTACIYDVHKREEGDARKMAEPVSDLCKNCFTCIQNCPQQALSMELNPVSEGLGNAYWTPHIIHTVWNEAEEGRLPVYGAGYGGPFKGEGFDAIWTDMSEIVRPTRDGIHGREYISTLVDLGRKLPYISDLTNPRIPRCLQSRVPVLLDTNPLDLNSKEIVLATVGAAQQVGSFAFLDAKNYSPALEPYFGSVILRAPLDEVGSDPAIPWDRAKMIELLLFSKFSLTALRSALDPIPVPISLGIRDPRVASAIFPLFEQGRADILHFYADSCGKNSGDGAFVSDVLKKLHRDFVKSRRRDEITLIGSGGMAAAEHVPKLIICGADAVVLDLSLLVAMGCRVCRECDFERCPADIAGLDPAVQEQRLVNMISAWRDQLLEVLSAMGIRDVRRLRGEMGRALFYEEIEKEAFGFIFEEKGPAR